MLEGEKKTERGIREIRSRLPLAEEFSNKKTARGVKSG